MEKRDIIDLTKKTYKITLLFPKKEPLRYRIREVADEILSGLIVLISFENANPVKYIGPEAVKERDAVFLIEKELEVINSYFEVAKWQNWLDYFDILEIQEEYGKIKENLIKEISKVEIHENLNFDFYVHRAETLQAMSSKLIANFDTEKKESKHSGVKLDVRKEKIMKVLERVERIQVGEINKLFPDVSKRTLRRDFQQLVKNGIVERLGEKNNTFYKIKGEKG